MRQGWVAMGVVALLTASSAVAKKPRKVVCPEGSSWNPLEKRCEGTLACPPGSHVTSGADAGPNCIADGISCPAASILVNGSCLGLPVCPEGSHLDDAGCVLNSALCPAGSHSEDGGCVSEQIGCPAGTETLDGGGCVRTVVGMKLLSGDGGAAAPASCDGAIAAHDETLAAPYRWTTGPAFQLQAGFDYTAGATVSSSAKTGYSGILLAGPGVQVEGALSNGQLYVGATFNWRALSAKGGTLSEEFLGGEIGVQCNCNSVHVWRFGIYAAYDIPNQITAGGVSYRSTFHLYQGLFMGFDLKLGGLNGPGLVSVVSGAQATGSSTFLSSAAITGTGQLFMGYAFY